MAYGKFKNKKTNWKSKSKGKGTMVKGKGDREMRFKQINAYKVKPEPFPRVLYTRMKYAKVSAFTTNAFQSATSHTFRLNSIWDPDETSAGHTTVGHSTMRLLYDRYLVTGCKVNIRFYDPSSDAVRVGCRLRINGANATAGKTMTELIEQPMTYQSGLADSGKQIKTFNFFVRPWTLMGLSKLEYMANTSKYSSAISGNPIDDQCLFDIFAIEGTGTVRTVAYAVKLTYYVQLYERKTLISTSY